MFSVQYACTHIQHACVHMFNEHTVHTYVLTQQDVCKWTDVNKANIPCDVHTQEYQHSWPMPPVLTTLPLLANLAELCYHSPLVAMYGSTGVCVYLPQSV